MADVAGRVDRFYAHSPGAWADVVRMGVREELVVRGVSPVVGSGAVQREGLPSPRIVFTGRLASDKGADVLVDAICLMAAPPPVLILGAGVLERIARTRGCSKSCRRSST